MLMKDMKEGTLQTLKEEDQREKKMHEMGLSHVVCVNHGVMRFGRFCWNSGGSSPGDETAGTEDSMVDFELLDSLGNDARDFVEQLTVEVDSLLRQLHGYQKDEEAYGAKDIKWVAHALKGVCGNLGAKRH